MDGNARRTQWTRAASWNLPRLASRSRRTVSLSRRAGSPAVDGADAQWLQTAFENVAVRRARVVGPSGLEPRPFVRRAEHARHAPRNDAASALLRPQGLEV